MCSVFWNQEVYIFQLCPFFKIAMAILGLLHLYKNFRISWSISVKKFWDFHSDCVECVEQFGEYCHHNYIKSSSLWVWGILLFKSSQNFLQQCFIVFSIQILYFVVVAKLIPKYSFLCYWEWTRFLNFIFGLLLLVQEIQLILYIALVSWNPIELVY